MRTKVNDPLFENDQRFAADNKLYIQFYSRPIINGAESNEAGRPIYHDIDCVRIMVPGDKLSIVDRLASEDDKRRFADQFAKYQAGQQTQLVGTPLEQVPWMSRSKVEEYKYFGIHSVEQLANASDSVGQRFPGFYGDRDKAKAFIEAASGNNARIAELERLLAEMQAKMQAPAQIAAPAVASAAEAASEPVAALSPVPKTVIKGK
ncbi:MAG: hypothetical protein ACHQX3_03720 [Nitrospirales bacterium]